MDLSFPDPILLALMVVIFYTAAIVVVCSLMTLFMKTFTKRRLDIMKMLNQGLTGLKVSLSIAALLWLMKIIIIETIYFTHATYVFIDILTVLFICIPMIV